MAGTPSGLGEIITDKRQLVAYLDSGSKPADQWSIGTEHEKFVFHRDTFRAPGYDGPNGIRALLESLAADYGWTPVYEGDHPIALTRGKASVSLEPGGQFELSGAPLADLHQTEAELLGHLQEVTAVGDKLGLGFLGAGFNPLWTRADIPWMPKGRYAIMKSYMPKVGSLGLDMMIRTCTVQVNLDYGSEADMVKKFRVSLALQPVATALFAASPFTEGRPNGFQSFRSHIWTDTDPDRCGILPFVFEDGMGFERYVDYMLDVPMYFVYRDGQYIDASGQSFRDFIDGKLPAYPGHRAHLGDFIDHLSTVFPEVRLKKFLEMRGADAGPAKRMLGLPALWVGLLYDTTALDAAWDLVKDWTPDDHAALRTTVPARGLATPFQGKTVRDLALTMLTIARDGLRNRRRFNAKGEDETFALDPLFAVAGSGRSYADDLLDAFHGPWQGNVRKIYAERAF